MDAGKLAVSVGEFKADGSARFRPAAANFGYCEFESVRLLDAHPVLGPADRVQDRRATHLNDAVDAGLGGAGVDVDLELDIRDDRLMRRVAGG
jgi:hypothetical protein